MGLSHGSISAKLNLLGISMPRGEIRAQTRTHIHSDKKQKRKNKKKKSSVMSVYVAQKEDLKDNPRVRWRMFTLSRTRGICIFATIGEAQKVAWVIRDAHYKINQQIKTKIKFNTKKRQITIRAFWIRKNFNLLFSLK